MEILIAFLVTFLPLQLIVWYGLYRERQEQRRIFEEYKKALGIIATVRRNR